jgi:hypothetical protein
MRKTNLALACALAALSTAPAIADAAPAPDAPARLQPAVVQGDTAKLMPAQYYYTRRFVVVRHRSRHYYRPWRRYDPYGYDRPYHHYSWRHRYDRPYY